MDRAFLDQMQQEMSDDARRVSVAMAAAHRRWHRFSRRGWNNCEKEPCHSVCVFLGAAAVIAMEVGAEGGDAA